ncbi:MAG: PKD domain-containing protein [Verrucomicrobiaceae bacterium]|nr:PKD domain-containing protein [Verrucomicrobiaceae bacterium]
MIRRTLLASAALLFIATTHVAADPVPVKIVPGVGITRGGQPYFVRGAAGDQHLDELVATGGNSIRTWTTRGLLPILDDAQKRGLTVCAGIWLEPECSWFSYSDAEHCARQTARVKKEVTEFRDHPALLFWGLGNEAEGDGNNVAYWKQLEVLAKAVKQLDPAHPTFTAVAGLQPQKIASLDAHTPSLDFVGINTYAALNHLRHYLAENHWQRPWVVTEYGPRGFWESPRAPWGAPIEQTSSDKAKLIRKAYQAAIQPGGDCWGGYVFLWGQKQEATSTWFGVFTAHGESTAVRDVMHELWKGTPPKNRAPDLTMLTSSAAKKEIGAGSEFQAEATATDPDGDPLTYHWTVTRESTGRDANGKERVTPPLPECVVKTAGSGATLRAPSKPGDYRVHLRLTDDHQHAATANFPIQVK